MKKRAFDYRVSIVAERTYNKQYTFQVDKSLLDHFQADDPLDLVAKVKITIHSSCSDFIKLYLEVLGSMTLRCDRTLKMFTDEFNIENKLFFLRQNTYRELDHCTYEIPASQQEIDCTQYIYDAIVSFIPIVKLHPDCEQDDAAEDEIIYTC